MNNIHIDWQLLVHLLDVIKWPALILFALWKFNDKIDVLLGRIIKLSGFGAQADFAPGAAQTSPTQLEEPEEPEVVEISETGGSIVDELQTKLSETQQEKEGLISEVTSTKSQLEFEKIYNDIFGSQLELLRKLLPYRYREIPGVFHLFLDRYFEEVKSKYSAAFKDWVTDTYIKYLIDGGLIVVEQQGIPVYHLSEKGEEFLTYIDRAKVNINRPF